MSDSPADSPRAETEFAAIENHGGKFIAITEARDVGALELALPRRACEILIG